MESMLWGRVLMRFCPYRPARNGTWALLLHLLMLVVSAFSVTTSNCGGTRLHHHRLLAGVEGS